MLAPIWLPLAALPFTFSLTQASHPQYRLSLSQTACNFSHPVSLPHEHPTKSFWTHGTPNANPLAREGSRGSLTTDVDIAIIGSGITGIGAAVHLVNILNALDMGMNVVVLEARDFCSGATGRNGGHLTPSIYQSIRSNAAKYGISDAIRGLAIENHTADNIVSFIKSYGVENDVDLVYSQHIDLFFTEEEEKNAKADYDAAKLAGIGIDGIDFLSGDQTAELYGPRVASVRYSGHNLWPLKAVTHFFQVAQKKFAGLAHPSKLTLHTHTPVTAIYPITPSHNISLPRRWKLSTPRGEVHAHTIIHATNAYAPYLLPFLTPTQGRDGIVPTRGQVIATRAGVTMDELQSPSYSANNGYEYWFPRPVNETNEHPLVILGGGRETATPGLERGVTDDSVINMKVSKTLREFLPKVYPSGWFPAGREPDMEWTGIMGYTESGSPFVGPVIDPVTGGRIDGQYIAAGYTGHGMPRAYGCAEALVQIVMSDILDKTWEAPEWFPRYFLTTSRPFSMSITEESMEPDVGQ
ncbi:FAD dependent oxidoreductase-domain-containing protein [Hysterangium stoloniferum]|nr:FAD dependent oxidoreductase-domain-containing protein [Hysterangium stoloniferum]